MSLCETLINSRVFSSSQGFEVGQARGYAFMVDGPHWNNKTFAHFGFVNWSKAEDENQKLIKQIEEWALTLKAELLVGPIDGTTMFSYRYRLNDFDREPFIGEPNNSPVDVLRLKALGFVPIETYQTVFIEDLAPLKHYWGPWKRRLNRLEFRALSEPLWAQARHQLPQVIDEVFADNPGYMALPHELVTSIFGSEFFNKLCLKTSRLIYLEDELVGFTFNYADAAAVYVKSAGLTKRARFKGLGFIAIVAEVIQHMDANQKLVACLMRENNFPDKLLRKEKFHRTEYALFGKSIISSSSEN